MGGHMIETIMTRQLWEESLSEKKVTRSVTIYLGEQTRPPKVTALINLSRVGGSGTAKAFIWSYEQLWPGYTYPITIQAGVPEPRSGPDPDELLKGPSVVTFSGAHSVTFALTVRNMFAYATCIVFIYRRTLLEEILSLPSRIFRFGQDR
jgi:hypothetical protein